MSALGTINDRPLRLTDDYSMGDGYCLIHPCGIEQCDIIRRDNEKVVGKVTRDEFGEIITLDGKFGVLHRTRDGEHYEFVSGVVKL
jgi:hypothetical protein